MFCPICGSPNDNGASKCQACGSALNTQINNAQVNPTSTQPQVTNVYVQQAPKVDYKEAEKAKRKSERRLGSRIVCTVLYVIVTFIAGFIAAAGVHYVYDAGALFSLFSWILPIVPYIVIMIVSLAGLRRQIVTRSIPGIILTAFNIVMPIVTEIILFKTFYSAYIA